MGGLLGGGGGGKGYIGPPSKIIGGPGPPLPTPMLVTAHELVFKSKIWLKNPKSQNSRSLSQRR